MATREILLEMVAENPNVTRKAIAARAGVTRERVRQILNSEGIKLPHAKAYSGPWCRTCNKRTSKNGMGICRPCYRLEHPPISFICETCVEPFELSKHEVKTRSRNGKSPRFCSKKCFGSFVATNYGFVAHPENAGKHNRGKTHCKHGHPFDEANTYISPNNPNARHCRTCDRRQKLAYHRNKRKIQR